MKISSSTIEALAFIIIGHRVFPHTLLRENNRRLMNFFHDLSSVDTFSSHENYVNKQLWKCNDTKAMMDIIKGTFSSLNAGDYKERTGEKLVRLLQNDGYKLIFERVDSLINKTGRQTYSNSLISDIQPIGGRTVEIISLAKLNHEFIDENILKAKEKLAEGDYTGAITNARTLVEALQKEIIRKSGKNPPNDGDLSKLYKMTKEVLNLDLSQKDSSDTLKQILGGLTSIMLGLGGLSNKMGDRHATTYKPSHHHAKLAVNVAFTFCEFLLDTYEYQKIIHKEQKNDK